MINGIWDRLPATWKFVVVNAAVIAVMALGGYLYIGSLNNLLAESHGLELEASFFLNKTMMRYVIGAGIIGIIVEYFFLRHLLKYPQSLNKQLLKGLAKKQLNLSFKEFTSNDIFETMTKNANAFFQMYKNFDQMKSARITLEVNSIKQLMNNIPEGVMLINPDKIVTHTNHNAEDILRLQPGEILNQTVSRYVSNETFLKSVDDALEKDEKVTQKECMVKEGEPIYLSVYPIKNKLGDTLRAIVVLTK